MVFDIKRFAVHDGPGIRTTVFFKGCPLRCIWCHNPESMAETPELFYRAETCIKCGACIKACGQGAHESRDGEHYLFRDRCTCCGACAAVCPTGALALVGKWMTVAEVVDAVMKDHTFYETSGGGMTVSGGEPMLQFDFLYALLEAAKAQHITTCLDTSGAAPAENYKKILPLVDLFLWDYKETNPDLHRKSVGAERGPLLQNLRMVVEAGAKAILRCPLIPGVNDSEAHLAGIARVASGIPGILEVNVGAYHALWRSKNQHLGKPDALGKRQSPTDEQVERWIRRIAGACDVPVKRS